MSAAAKTAKEQLLDDVMEFRHDPLGFVLYAFDWGEGELAKYPEGPDEWQRAMMNRMGEKLKAGEDVGAVIQEAISSGHGVGKSAFVGWILMWAMSTFEDTRGVVTANTDAQLRTKTWAELSKWYRLCITRHWFKLTATAIHSIDPDHERTWRIDIIPWSLTNTEAFAGLHNQGKRIIVIFDEASAIPPLIWEVTEGVLTDADTEIIWLVFGNPTRNDGRFIECGGKYRHRWTYNAVDSRTVRITNKAQIAKWIEDEGEDSDFVRVRVRGIAPRSSMLELISRAEVEACNKYVSQGHEIHAKVFGMDVARFGDDYTVVVMRQGRKVQILKKWRGLDTMQSASHLVELAQLHNPDMIFIDGGGVGGGVVDRAVQLLGKNKVCEIGFGEEADNPKKYANKRAEMWGEMREAIRGKIELPVNEELLADLTGPLYSFDSAERMVLERKKDMKRRGLASPDCGDGLALTYAKKVIRDHKPPAPPRSRASGGSGAVFARSR